MRLSFLGSSHKLPFFFGLTFFALIVLHQLSYFIELNPTKPLLAEDIIATCSQKTTDRRTNQSSGGIHSDIPQTIHQIWKTDNLSTYSVEASHQSWKNMFEPANFTVKLWTDNDILQLIRSDYPWLLATYEGYPQNIERADIARLVVVHAEGGIYADLDVYPKSVENLQCLQRLGIQTILAPTAGTGGVSNHFFMAEKGSGFLEWALHEAKRREISSSRIYMPYLQVFWATGPLMVTSAFLQYAWMYSGGKRKLAVMDESYRKLVISHAAGRSWHGSDGRLLNYIADHAALEDLCVTIPMLFVMFVFVYLIVKRRARNSKSVFV